MKMINDPYFINDDTFKNNSTFIKTHRTYIEKRLAQITEKV